MKTITILLNFEIDVYEVVECSVDLNLEDSEFIDFEESMDLIFQIRGYELQRSYDSNRNDSITRYYVYTKIEDDVRLKAFVSVRVSDHYSPDRKIGDKTVKEYQLRNKYVAKQAKKLAQSLDSKNEYLARSINIVFNKNRYETYDDALNEFTKRLDRYEKQIQTM